MPAHNDDVGPASRCAAEATEARNRMLESIRLKEGGRDDEASGGGDRVCTATVLSVVFLFIGIGCQTSLPQVTKS